MPEKRSRRLALLLIGAGALLLLVQSGLWSALPNLITFALVLAIAVAIWQGTASRFKFWQRIVAVGVLLVFALPGLGDFAGVFVLGVPAAIFATTYLRDRRRWWAILPAGVLSSLTLVVLFEQSFPNWDAGPVFFLGLAATFSYLYLLPAARGGQRWALYPAIGCIVLTVLANDPSGGGPSWFMPVVLIALGLALLWWWRQRGR